MVNLGVAFGDLGDNQKQKELLERALSIQERAYGHAHVAVALTLCKLGVAFGGLGEYQQQKAVSYTHLTLPTILRV